MSQGSGQYDINLDVKVTPRARAEIDNFNARVEAAEARVSSLASSAAAMPSIPTGSQFSSSTARTSGNVRATTRPSRPLMIPNNAGFQTSYPMMPPGGAYFGATGLTPGGSAFTPMTLAPGGGVNAGSLPPLIPVAAPPGTGMPGMNPYLTAGVPGMNYGVAPVAGPGGNVGTARLAGPGGNWAAYVPPPPNVGNYNPLAFGGMQPGWPMPGGGIGVGGPM